MTNTQTPGVSDEVLLQKHDDLYTKSLDHAHRDLSSNNLSPHQVVMGTVAGSFVGGIVGVGAAIGMQAANLINLPQFAGLASSPVAVGVMAAGAVVGAAACVWLLKTEREVINDIARDNNRALEETTQQVFARPDLATQIEARRAKLAQKHAEMEAARPDYTAERVGAFAIGAFMGGSR